MTRPIIKVLTEDVADAFAAERPHVAPGIFRQLRSLRDQDGVLYLRPGTPAAEVEQLVAETASFVTKSGAQPRPPDVTKTRFEVRVTPVDADAQTTRDFETFRGAVADPFEDVIRRERETEPTTEDDLREFQHAGGIR